MLGSDYKERLEDGKVLLYVRNGIFYARVYRGDRRYIYKSLKTKKIVEARKSAIRLFYEVDIRRSEGLPLQQLSFAVVIDEYVKLREKHHEQSQLVKSTASFKDAVSIHMLRQIRRVVKFWIEYCGRTPVDKIDNAKLQEYVIWRKDYYGKIPVKDRPKNYKLHPADKTLEWEVTLAKTILKYATDRGYRGLAPLPTYRYKSSKAIVRPAFKTTEYATIYKNFRRWINEASLEDRSRYTREMLRNYVHILANSGMRVGEANNLKSNDVIEFIDQQGRRNFQFHVQGKTGKRVVIPRTNVVPHVVEVMERNAVASYRVTSKKQNKRNQDNKGDWFFRMSDGNKIITLIDQFLAYLKYVCDFQLGNFANCED